MLTVTWQQSHGFKPTEGAYMLQISDEFPGGSHTITKYLSWMEYTNAVDTGAIFNDFVDKTVEQYNQGVPELYQVDLTWDEASGMWDIEYVHLSMRMFNKHGTT